MVARLLDQFGNPIDLGRLRETVAGPTTAGVRQVVGGHPSRGLVPAKVARLMDAAEQGDSMAYMELAEDVEEKYWHYASVLGTRKRAVTQLEVTVVAASDEADDVRAADLVRDWINTAELDDTLFDILDAIGKGFSVCEIDWDVSGREWMPRDLVYRDPRWFEFDRTDGRTLRLRDEHGQLSALQPYKFVVHQARAKSGLPIRSGLARLAAFAWMFQSYTQKDWQAFLEVYGQPLRLGKYHQGASQEEKNVLLQAVSRIGADAAAIVPEGMNIEFVEVGGSTTDQYERRADWLDRQISKVVVGQTLTTEVGGGSRAAAQVHDGVRDDIGRSDGKQAGATLTRDVARPLVDLNLGQRKRYPRIRIALADENDLTAKHNTLVQMIDRGLEVEASVVRDELGYPEPAAGAKVLRASGGQQQPPAEAQPPAPPTKATREVASRAVRPAAQGDAADQLAAQLNDVAGPAMDDLTRDVAHLLDSVATLEEFRDRLLSLYPMLDAGVIGAIVGDALTIAMARGRADLLDGI